MRPLVVLILVLGAVAALVFAVVSITKGTSRTTQAGRPNVVRGADEGARPAAVLDNPDQVTDPAEPLVEPQTTRETLEDVKGGGAWSNELLGKVVNPEGMPVQDAEVHLMVGSDTSPLAPLAYGPADEIPDPRPRKRARTDAEGAFRFTNIAPASDWALVVTHPDYSTTTVNDLVMPKEGRVEEIVTVGTGFLVFGFVREKDSGVVIPNAVLVLDNPVAVIMNRGSSPGRREAKTNDDGYYEFTNVSLQNPVLICRAEGYGTLMHSNLPFFQSREEKRVQQDCELAQGMIIAGRVVGPDMEGLEGAFIDAITHGENYSSRGETRSKKDGEFAIVDLAEGVYTLRTQLAGYEADPVLKVEAGDTNVTIQLFEQGSVTGRVVDAGTNRPVETFSCIARVVHPTNNAYGAIVSRGSFRNRTDGSFELSNISENTYIVQADADGYASSFSDPFTVTQGMATPDVVVRLTQGGTLRGKVLDSYTGDPVVGAVISTNENNFIDSDFTRLLGGMVTTAMSKKSAKTDKDGNFTLDLLTPGVYQVRVEHDTYTPISRNDVNIANGGVDDFGTVLLTRGATVHGTVYSADGRPAPGLSVYLRPTNGEIGKSGQARTDASGRYTLKNVAAGTYKLSAARAQNQLGGSPFDTILDMKNSEVEIAFLDSQEYTQDLYMGGGN